MGDPPQRHLARLRQAQVGAHRRGPNIFQTALTDAEFLDAVVNGRQNGMPAWGGVLSTDEIWKVHAFVLSRDRL